jgi:hypothetical protein
MKEAASRDEPPRMAAPGRLVLVVLALTSARRWLSKGRPVGLAL